MERALDRGILEEALGSHTLGALPSADELIDLIANVEIQAFMQNFEVDAALLRAAWYLHGIASASQALELYSRPRQRRAFAVSAHIFDLALNDATSTDHDRLTIAFGAQVGYRRSGLDPNATAVYRRVANLLHNDVDVPDHVNTLALEAGVAFLGLEPRNLGILQRAWRRRLSALSADLGLENLQSTMFGPVEQVVLATSALLSYLRTGDPEQVDIARSALLSVLDLSAGEGDHDARWVASHLLPIADGMQNSSVWTVLPAGTPPAVAQAFTVGSPPVLTLWPPQQELLSRASQNPLSAETTRMLLSVPTSAGKTLLAQLMICAHLATQAGSVCYVTPLRSLGREMRQALRSRLRILRRELGLDLPDYATMTDAESLEAAADTDYGDVEVMTPERLMQQLRHDPDDTLSRYSLFVIDEAHLLAQSGRGFTLESLLSFLLAASSARLVLLSGVLGNAGTLSSWLDPSEPEVLFTSDWRGPRRMHALLYSDANWDLKTISPRGKRAKLPTRVTVPLRGKLRVRPAEGQVVDLFTGELGVLALNQSSDGSESKKDTADSTAGYKIVAAAAAALLHAGSLLMVVSTRAVASDAATILSQQLKESTRTAELSAYFIERLGEEHPLIQCVQHGVAFHHAGLPVDVLDAIEEAMRSDVLQAVVATSTLTDGVNLPVRTVLISETTFPGQQVGNQLNAARLLNAVGRAGRAGRETEGWIVLALQKTENLADFDQLTPDSAALAAQSTMLGAQALESLAHAEALLAGTADAILQLTPGPAADFVGYVWFVLSTLDRLQGAWTSNLSAVTDHLLGFKQMNAHLRSRWAALAASVQATYETTDPVSRQLWNRTGTTLGTASRIEQLVTDLVHMITAAHPEPKDPFDDQHELSLGDSLALFDGAELFDALLSLPEAERAWRFRPRRNGGGTIDVPLLPVLHSWLTGVEIAPLAEQMLPTVNDLAWRLEHTVDAISSTFEHYLSWIVGVVVEQANSALEKRNASVVLRRDLGSLIRFGVDTAQAVVLLTQGVQSRRLAHRLGRLAEERGLTVDELREWLAKLQLSEWRAEFDANPREVLELLEFARSRRQGLLRQLLETGECEVKVVLITDAVTVSRPVELRSDNDLLGQLMVCHADDRVGLVGPSSHTDVLDVLGSGLDVAAQLQGEVLTFSASS